MAGYSTCHIMNSNYENLIKSLGFRLSVHTKQRI